MLPKRMPSVLAGMSCLWVACGGGSGGGPDSGDGSQKPPALNNLTYRGTEDFALPETSNYHTMAAQAEDAVRVLWQTMLIDQASDDIWHAVDERTAERSGHASAALLASSLTASDLTGQNQADLTPATTTDTAGPVTFYGDCGGQFTYQYRMSSVSQLPDGTVQGRTPDSLPVSGVNNKNDDDVDRYTNDASWEQIYVFDDFCTQSEGDTVTVSGRYSDTVQRWFEKRHADGQSFYYESFTTSAERDFSDLTIAGVATSVRDSTRETLISDRSSGPAGHQSRTETRRLTLRRHAAAGGVAEFAWADESLQESATPDHPASHFKSNENLLRSDDVTYRFNGEREDLEAMLSGFELYLPQYGLLFVVASDITLCADHSGIATGTVSVFSYHDSYFNIGFPACGADPVISELMYMR